MYVGIDIGGTSTRVALFRTREEPEFALLARFPTLPEYEQELGAIQAAILNSEESDIAGIGLAFGGKMRPDGQAVAVAPNLPAYVGRPFARDLERIGDCGVRLAHDTVCGLLGEHKFGILQESKRCAYLTLSTGTGAAIHLEKPPNRLTVSIEVGHQLLDGNALVCLCGQVGCLETFTGGKQLEYRLGHAMAQIIDQAFWTLFCEKLALGLVNLAQLTRIEVVAVSGAIVLNNEFLLPLLQQKVSEQLRNAPLQLFQATLGEDAPLVGAVTLLATPEETILH